MEEKSRHFSNKEIEYWIKKYGLSTMGGVDRWSSRIRRYNKKVHELWEVAKQLKEPERVVKQLEILALYKDRLKEEAGDLIGHCSDLIESRTDLLMEDYFNDIDECLKKIEMRNPERTPWLLCGETFLFHIGEVLQCEEDERLGGRYELEDDDIIHYVGYAGGKPSFAVSNMVGTEWVLDTYCRYRGTFPYKLCSRLIDFYVERSVGTDAWERFVALIRTVCLYTALINQEDDLKDNKLIFVDHSAQAPQTTTPAPQAQAKKKTKQPREVFTERATKYFEKAEKEGYLEKVGDKYEWLYRGGKVALVYFFIRIYEPESPPYEQLEPVFGVKNLTSSRSNLVNSTWYKDELKRQKMTSEELKLEERRQKLRKPSSWFPELKNFFD